MLPFSRSFAFIAAAVIFMLTQACAPGMQVTRLAPSYYNLGNTKRVAVLEVNGDQQAAAQVITNLQKRVMNDGYYTLVVATGRGASFVVNTPGGTIEIGEARRIVDADVYVNAYVTAYDYRESEVEDKKVIRYRPEGTTRINFQVVKADGRVIVFRDYDGSHSGTSYEAGKKPSQSPAAVLDAAIRSAVGSFAYDITPRKVTERIVFDDTLEILKPGIKLAENGDLEGAEREWTNLLTQNPNTAGAMYNIGVLLETRGDFEKAAQNYRSAIELGGLPLYQEALDNMNRRLAEAQSLNQGI